MGLTLSTSIQEITWMESRTRKSLTTAGFGTVGAILLHYPHRYEDRRSFDAFPQEAQPAPVCLHGIVTDVEYKKMGFKQGYVKITVVDAGDGPFSHPLVCRWFHMSYLMKSFAADQEIVLFGKPKLSGRKLVMDHPEFEIVGSDPDETMIHLRRIVPVYHEREGVPQKKLREAAFDLLERLDPDSVGEVLRKPSDKGEFAGLNRFRALRTIHFPDTFEELDRARRYLALEEFFALQLNVLRRRKEWDAHASAAKSVPGKLLDQWIASLPFDLTGAQLRVINEIRRDLEQARPMHRLLQGDVGSGKTFVALAAILLVVEAGFQAALMAPTQILAEQHYLNFRKHLEPLGIRIGLRTSSRKEDGFLELWSGGEETPQILIGTHALIAEAMTFDKLGLVVIDEQHKFGVNQRMKLVKQGAAPDVLVMSATPIPRTLTLSVYGDLDVSILDEMPAGRGTVQTAVRENPDLAQVAAFLRNQVEAGRQAYLVYPLVNETDGLRLKAATAEFEAWSTRLTGIPCALVHGRLSGEEKDRVMTSFRNGEAKVLIATTVIEVGVDVPNATVMIVFEAERFGLAQLHQLRGRIGRGEHRSWCILVTHGQNDEAVARLKVLETTTDGFAVAEQDLKMRGPGELLGTAQSGIPGLQLGDLVRDEKLVRVARMLAEEVLTRDPTMQKPEHAHLQHLMMDKETASPLG